MFLIFPTPGRSTMRYENFKWVEYADGGYLNRNKVISTNELWNRLEANGWGKNPDMQDWFVSVCRFDDSFRRYRDTHVNSKGNPTVEKYEGLHIIDRALLEIDHPEAINGSITFSTDIVKHLEDHYGINPETELVKDVSGNNGFHFEIPSGLFLPEPHLKLFKIHELFVRSLFPPDWCKHGNFIDLNSYQINRILRLRSTRNKQFGFKVSLNGSFSVLKDEPEKVTEFWANPSTECTAKEFITGEWYWNFQPKPNLVELWKVAQDKVENEGKTRVFIPASQRGKFSKAKIDKMPKCIQMIHERMSDNVRGDGLFNISVCGLTLYYLHAGYNSEATKRMVRGLTQPTAKNPDELDEIEKSMASMIDEDGQPRYSWTCGKDSFPHLHNFCSNGDLKGCPLVCNTTEKVHGQLMGIGQAAKNKAMSFSKGADPYTFGISQLDDFIGYVREGSSVVIQAVPTVGKTAFMERISKHQAGVAKKRGEIVLWIPPEDSAEDTAEQHMMQQGRMTVEQLIHSAENGGFSEKFWEWFNEYDDTIKIWKVKEFSVKEIAQAIEATQSSFNRKVGAVYYDGVSFLKPDSSARIGEAGVAQDIARLVADKQTRGIFAVHPKKVEDNEKEGKTAVNKRLGMYGAYGSMYYAALGRTIISLWKEDDYTMMVGCEKAKDRLRGQIKMIKPFPMVFDHYFSLWEEQEAMRMSVSDFGQDPRHSFITRPKDFV